MRKRTTPEAPALRCSPPVALPLKLRERGSDAWVEDANGVEVIARTHGFKSDKAHEDWCRWVVQTANIPLTGGQPPKGGSND